LNILTPWKWFKTAENLEKWDVLAWLSGQNVRFNTLLEALNVNSGTTAKEFLPSCLFFIYLVRKKRGIYEVELEVFLVGSPYGYGLCFWGVCRRKMDRNQV
jgi:hypothetical protein